MVIHAIVKACTAEQLLHSFMANMLETSMISFFIAIQHMALGECWKTLIFGRIGLNLMDDVMTIPPPGLWFTKAAWDEYIEVMKLVLDGQEDLLKRLGCSFATCSDYWCAWAH